jgi:hypothetical protein
VYLRALGEPIRLAAGLPASELFPLTKASHIGAAHLRIVKIELAREAATLIMLAAAAGAVARSFRTWLAAFAICFGAWDLAFYASLRVLIGWPASFATWDLLFLLPVPWVGPVLAPVIVAASLVLGGVAGLVRDPPRVDWISWALLTGGGVIIFFSFIWDWRNVVNSGIPHDFPWLLFAAGQIAGVAGCGRALVMHAPGLRSSI